MNWLITGSIIVFISATAQGLTGFGFSLLAVPALAMFIPQTESTPILIIFAIAMNIMMLIKKKLHFKIKYLWLIAVFAIIGTPLGVLALKYIDSRYIKLIAGIVIMVSALSIYIRNTSELKRINLFSAIAGLCSGILNGSITTSGPPIVLILSKRGLSKNEFRDSITLLALVSNSFAFINLFFSGFFTNSIATQAAVFLPALFAGIFTGIFLARFTNEKLFRTLTIALVLIMGAVSSVTAVLSLI